MVPESLFREKVKSGVAGVLVLGTNNHSDSLKLNYELSTIRNYFFKYVVFVTKI